MSSTIFAETEGRFLPSNIVAGVDFTEGAILPLNQGSLGATHRIHVWISPAARG